MRKKLLVDRLLPFSSVAHESKSIVNHFAIVDSRCISMVSLRPMYSSERALSTDGPRGLVSEWRSSEAVPGTLLLYKVTV